LVIPLLQNRSISVYRKQYAFICEADYSSSAILRAYVSPLTSHAYLKKEKMWYLYTNWMSTSSVLLDAGVL